MEAYTRRELFAENEKLKAEVERLQAELRTRSTVAEMIKEMRRVLDGAKQPKPHRFEPMICHGGQCRICGKGKHEVYHVSAGEP